MSMSQVVDVNLTTDGAHQWAIVNVIIICVQHEVITHTIQYVLLTILFIHGREVGGGLLSNLVRRGWRV